MVGRADLGPRSDQLLGNGGVAITSCPMQRRVALALSPRRKNRNRKCAETPTSFWDRRKFDHNEDIVRTLSSLAYAV